MPDWRNLGVLLRVMLAVNLLVAGAVVLQIRHWADWWSVFLETAAWVQPLLLVCLLFLALVRDLLWRCHPRWAQALVLVVVGSVAALFWDAGRFLEMTAGGGPALFRFLVVVLGGALLVLIYFDLRALAFSPRVAEANLQALNARIRPHFLFNSLNTVIALIRTDPRRAELALEELADLFRALLRDTRDLVLLSDEIALGRQYLELEKLRLGDRLQVVWEIEAVPEEMLVPPLMLQPLLENAIFHGIEPALGSGTLHISLQLKNQSLQIVMTNPLLVDARMVRGGGNHMALRNIRERLALYYDLEARLSHGEIAGTYQVKIELPCRRAGEMGGPAVSCERGAT